MVKIQMSYEYDFDIKKEYTTIEVAEILGVSSRYVQRLLKQGKIEFLHKATTRTGGHIISGKMIVDFIIRYQLTKGTVIKVS
ncbi:helix-turn-helix domain-containing protein [Alkaliphilus sp. B6464]|uniref:helix-turn-helix domain-containing protein n=1 Tax=Alkaliphilus sp. B6464 TaxID=2731219 RepID=UPI001BA95C07|nr:helix-turn-helix domain-containing protein [Alkaliphilus sp. B6464]QUH21779.1 helix-turn-helix domain-containing protein [Alkaliphilus sp. B6464]